MARVRSSFKHRRIDSVARNSPHSPRSREAAAESHRRHRARDSDTDGADHDAVRTLLALSRGNDRFARNPRYAAQRHATATHGQSPQAVIIGCSDSRAPPVLVFDRKRLGTLFEVRVAGEAVSDTDVESVAYAVDHFPERLGMVVVLAHTRCGAVSAVVEDVLERGRTGAAKLYPSIVASIRPSVLRVLERHPADSWPSREALVTACAVRNACDKCRLIRKRVRGIEREGIPVVPALYDVETGIVSWLSGSFGRPESRRPQSW